MKITIVHENNYRMDANPSKVILSKNTDLVPINGDTVKVGHTLSGFEAYTVKERVFRSIPTKEDDMDAFQEVILVVTDHH